MADKKKHRRSDGQLTAMAGEFLVAGKLFKRGYQVSVTLGNAKSIDLFVHNPKTGRTFNVQVKTQRHKNCYPMHKENIRPDIIFVFVRLNGVKECENFFIVPGKTISDDTDGFYGSSYRSPKPPKFPAINYGPLKEYQDNWDVFEQIS